MSQHFLLSPRAKTLTVAQVMRLSNEEAETLFARIRWPETNGEPVCPYCGGLVHYTVRRARGPLRWRCKACDKEFSISSGTLFASHKMPLQVYLAAIALALNEVKGKNALALSRDLGTSYKTSFVLMHKIREALGSEMKGQRVGCDGCTVEVDGMYAGGHVRPANLKENRVDRRLARNQSGKRKVVVIARERDGRIISNVFKTEGQSVGWLTSHVAKGSNIVADEASSWNSLHGHYNVSRIDHGEAYSLNGISSNLAESFFARLRRGERGHFHHIAGPYLANYARESSWREDNRRVSNGDQTQRAVKLAMSSGPSVDFCGYWQRHKAA